MESKDINIEQKYWFNNKQVLTLLAAAITLTFEATYFYFQFAAMEQRHSADMEQMKTEHEADMELLREDFLYEVKLVREDLRTTDERLGKKIPLIYKNDDLIKELTYEIRTIKKE